MKSAAALHNSFCQHGGRIDAATALFPDVSQPWLDLSTGISPWAYPIGAIDPQSWTHLPSPELLAGLEASAAATFGAEDAAEVVAVPGSDMAIRLIASLVECKRAAIIEPIYSGHRAAWPDAIAVTLQDMVNYDLAICANPNNPDGRLIPPSALRAANCQMVVDEAFADANPSESILPDRNGAIVLRSFGKFYGLAGIRLGFVIAHRGLADKCRAQRGDWPVSGPAIAIATLAYQDIVWRQMQRERLAESAKRLKKMLTNSGLEIVGGTSLFQLVRHGAAAHLFEHLAGFGILARPFIEHNDWLRFGLPGSENHWERLACALEKWRAI